MLTEPIAREFASHWIEAWNAHDLEEVISHYADDVEYFSVFASRLLNNPAGKLKGKEIVKEYFANALARYPDLEFVLLDVFVGVRSVVLRYKSVNDLTAAEVFEIDDKGLVTRVQCHYDRT